MDKTKVADILDEIGTLLELKGENPFKCRAFHNAARVLAGVTEDIEVLVNSGDIRKIKGIGESLAANITELVQTGKSTVYNELRSEIPSGLFDILKLQGVGPKKVKFLYDKLKISSLDELEIACKAGKLESFEGFGKKSEVNILASIEAARKNSSKFLINVAQQSADEIFETVKKFQGVIRVEIAGSLRRKKEVIGDIDIVASAKKKDVSDIMKIFVHHP